MDPLFCFSTLFNREIQAPANSNVAWCLHFRLAETNRIRVAIRFGIVSHSSARRVVPENPSESRGGIHTRFPPEKSNLGAAASEALGDLGLEYEGKVLEE